MWKAFDRYVNVKLIVIVALQLFYSAFVLIQESRSCPLCWCTSFVMHSGFSLVSWSWPSLVRKCWYFIQILRPKFLLCRNLIYIWFTSDICISMLDKLRIDVESKLFHRFTFFSVGKKTQKCGMCHIKNASIVRFSNSNI